MTAVHESILEDLIFPTEITAKRIRVATDGHKTIRCFLDAKDATSLEYKLDSFSSVYRKLTGKEVAFMFRVSTLGEQRLRERDELGKDRVMRRSARQEGSSREAMGGSLR